MDSKALSQIVASLANDAIHGRSIRIELFLPFDAEDIDFELKKWIHSKRKTDKNHTTPWSVNGSAIRSTLDVFRVRPDDPRVRTFISGLMVAFIEQVLYTDPANRLALLSTISVRDIQLIYSLLPEDLQLSFRESKEVMETLQLFSYGDFKVGNEA